VEGKEGRGGKTYHKGKGKGVNSKVHHVEQYQRGRRGRKIPKKGGEGERNRLQDIFKQCVDLQRKGKGGAAKEKRRRGKRARR